MRKRTSIEHDNFFLLFILGSRLQNLYSNVGDEINDVQYVSVPSISLHLAKLSSQVSRYPRTCSILVVCSDWKSIEFLMRLTIRSQLVRAIVKT